MSIAVEIKNLSKHYKNVIALSDLSIDINQGEIFGIIGPNGAGKSTTLKIITTLLTATSGSAKVFGVDVTRNPEEIRKMISYLPEEAGSYKQLTGREYLEFMAGLLGLPNEESASDIVKRGIDLAGLGERIDDRTKEYSKGMRRKLLIARALMSKPRLAVLDEPASGLDVKHAYYVRGIIKDYVREKGITVLLSSHNMLEVEYLCDRVCLLDEGRLIDIGTPAELISKYSAINLEEVFIKATGSALPQMGSES
ncbi:MAG: ABC transporter ATP-binding protein [Thermoplasmata archaeon]|nr:ABC transporter ATP-binding protein [Thermoplasmata archaeon]